MCCLATTLADGHQRCAPRRFWQTCLLSGWLCSGALREQPEGDCGGAAQVGEASLALNLEQRQGRATVEVAGPRFSGLQGRSLSGAFRWERDVVRLERAVLEQAASRCAASVRLRTSPQLACKSCRTAWP